MLTDIIVSVSKRQGMKINQRKYLLTCLYKTVLHYYRFMSLSLNLQFIVCKIKSAPSDKVTSILFNVKPLCACNPNSI